MPGEPPSRPPLQFAARLASVLWARLTEPSRALRPPDQRREAGLIASLLLPVLLLGSLFLALHTLPDPGYRPPAAALGGLAVMLAAYVLSRTPRYRIGAALAMAAFPATVLAIAFTAYNALDFKMLLAYLALGILLSSVLLPFWATALLAAVDVLGILLLPLLVPQIPFHAILSPLTFLAMATAVTAIFLRYRNIWEAERQAQLAESEARYRQAVETSPNPIFSVGPDGLIQTWNAACSEAFQFGREIVGQPYTRLLRSPADASALEAMVARVFQGESLNGVEIAYRRRDGSDLFSVSRLYPLRCSNGEVRACVLANTDITARRQAEEAEREQRRLAEALRDTAAALNSTLDIEEVLRRILSNVGRVVPHDAANIILVESGMARIVENEGYTARGLDKAALAVQYKVSETPYLLQMARTGRGLVIPDTERYPGWVSRPHTGWVRSYAGAPIRLEGQVVGFLNLDSATPGFFTAEHAERLQAFADQAAVAIHNARLYEQVQRHAAELEERVAERTAELYAANADLRALAKVKDEFVANVSHEVRTPISNIKLYHKLLVMNPSKFSEYMATLDRETERLEHIVEDLLYLSRLDQGQIPTTLTRIDLNALAETYVSDRSPLAESKGLTLDLSPAENLPPVEGDQMLLGQALSVLLTNALNYTPPGGRVAISTHTRRRGSGTLVGLRVSDTGPGIEPDELAHLFRRFFRGKAAQASGMPGTGLGLAIAREIADRHGGWIEIASEGVPGKGTVATLWLPACEGEGHSG